MMVGPQVINGSKRDILNCVPGENLPATVFFLFDYRCYRLSLFPAIWFTDQKH